MLSYRYLKLAEEAPTKSEKGKLEQAVERLPLAIAGFKAPSVAPIPAGWLTEATDQKERLGFFKKRRILREAGLSPREFRVYQREGFPSSVAVTEGSLVGQIVDNLKSRQGFLSGVEDKELAILGPPNMSEAAFRHEVGHLQNFRDMKKVPGLFGATSLSRQIAQNVATPLLSAAAAASKEPSLAPGYIGLTLSAPMLLDEGLASLKATQGLVRAHGLREGLKKAITLVPAFGTYLTQAATPLGIGRFRQSLKAEK